MGAKRRTRKRWGLGILVVALALAVGRELWIWPEVARLAQTNPKTTAFIESFRQQQRARGSDDRVLWVWVGYPQISPHLKRAVLVAEDIDFFSHRGFAVEEIKLALREAVESGEAPRGASTLTQQLAKNLWLSSSRSPWRKLKEAMLTRQLEAHLSKRRILELYLNVVEFGPGVYGAEAAARHFFDRSAAALTPEQAAGLAAGLPRPGSWHPGSASQVYRRRVERILQRMEKAAWLWQVI